MSADVDTARDAELMAIEATAEDDDEQQQQETRNGRSGSRTSHEPLGGSQPRQDGHLISAAAVSVNPYGGTEDDECCGVCLENPGPGGLITLWCCKNTLCVRDAQMIGVCPFCREEPLMWDLKK